jgi:hypothetical protein
VPAVTRLALVGAVSAGQIVLALSLAGCTQPSTANDNRNPLSTDRTQTQPTIIRTPVRVEDAPLTEPLPGPTGGPVGSPPAGAGPSFSPGPGTEGDDAESSQGGPDGT